MGAVLSLTQIAPDHGPKWLFTVSAALHLFSYSTLFGMTIYQTFVMTSLAFKALPIGPFTVLQKRVFPVFFGLQCALAGAALMTYPYPAAELVFSWDIWLFGTMGVMALMNWQWYGPLTSKIMSLRIHQGKCELED